MKTITLGDMFTEKQIERALNIIAETTTGLERHQRLRDEIVLPNMARIDKLTGQENNAGYFAYALEYALTQESHP